jgi:hypothetical protein
MVSERDRAFMRRIGDIKSTSHEEAGAGHRALAIDERLRRSWALYLATHSSTAAAASEDDPSPFYERARALGLYQP